MKKVLLLAIISSILITLPTGCGNPPAFRDNTIGSREPAVRPEPMATTPLKVTVPDQYRDLVTVHNRYRKQLGLPPLKWSADLADYAQAWADRLKSRGCDMAHRPDNPHGENLAWSSGPMSGAQVVHLWASEKDDYDYPSNTCRPGKVCGHWTQMIWADTRNIGCGMARCGNSEIWVCNYDPPGNYIGQKPY